MQDRFKFRVVIKAYYYSQNSDDDKEINFILNNVDVLDSGDIGTQRDHLNDVLSKTSLTQYEKASLIEIIEANSYGINDYVTITPYNIMQCTGLKDKNGTLIYEGDILEIDDGDDWIIGRLIVVNEQGCFCLKDTADYKNNISAIFDSNVPLIDGRIEKIIGNIHENPELLEANQ